MCITLGRLDLNFRLIFFSSVCKMIAVERITHHSIFQSQFHRHTTFCQPTVHFIKDMVQDVSGKM